MNVSKLHHVPVDFVALTSILLKICLFTFQNIFGVSIICDNIFKLLLDISNSIFTVSAHSSIKIAYAQS